MNLYYEINNVISEQQFNHHVKLYDGYLDKVSNIYHNMDNYSNLGLAKKDFQYNLNGIILHEMYFQNICKINELQVDKSCIFEKKDFEKWVDDFKKTALSTRGWVIYCCEQRTNKFFNISLASHDEGLVCGMTPLIVLDVYEHAYYTDYSNDKGKYIDNFIESIDWNIVKNRLENI